MRTLATAVAVLGLYACVVPGIDYEGRQCDAQQQCIDGYRCVAGVCTRSGGGGSGGAAAGGRAGGSAGGSTAGGSTAGGSTAGGSTAGGATAGGATAGGATAGGAAIALTHPSGIVSFARPVTGAVDVAISRAGIAYVTGVGPDGVRPIPLDGGTFAVIPTDTSPGAIALGDNEGALLVTHPSAASGLAIYLLDGGSTVRFFSQGADVVSTRSGARAWVAQSSNTIGSITVASGSWSTATGLSISQSMGPRHIAIDEDRGVLYGSVFNESIVIGSNIFSAAPSATTPGFAGSSFESAVPHPDGGLLYMINREQPAAVQRFILAPVVAFVDQVTTPDGGGSPINGAITPDWKQLWVPLPASGEVMRIDLDTFARLPSIVLGGAPTTVAFDSTGSTAVVLDGTQAIILR